MCAEEKIGAKASEQSLRMGELVIQQTDREHHAQRRQQKSNVVSWYYLLRIHL